MAGLTREELRELGENVAALTAKYKTALNVKAREVAASIGEPAPEAGRIYIEDGEYFMIFSADAWAKRVHPWSADWTRPGVFEYDRGDYASSGPLQTLAAAREWVRKHRKASQ